MTGRSLDCRPPQPFSGDCNAGQQCQISTRNVTRAARLKKTSCSKYTPCSQECPPLPVSLAGASYPQGSAPDTPHSLTHQDQLALQSQSHPLGPVGRKCDRESELGKCWKAPRVEQWKRVPASDRANYSKHRFQKPLMKVEINDAPSPVVERTLSPCLHSIGSWKRICSSRGLSAQQEEWGRVFRTTHASQIHPFSRSKSLFFPHFG